MSSRGDKRVVMVVRAVIPAVSGTRLAGRSGGSVSLSR